MAGGCMAPHPPAFLVLGAKEKAMQVEEVVVLVLLGLSLGVLLIVVCQFTIAGIKDKRRSIELEDELEANRRLMYMQ